MKNTRHIMRPSLLTFIAATLAFASACDRIEANENGEYVTYAGSVAEWTQGTTIADPVQRVYVEKYTGPRCTNCPAADRTLDAVREQVGENLVQVSVNSMTDQFGAPGPNSPDMRTDDGAVWETEWGVSSFPTAFINRTATAFTGDMANIGSAILQALSQDAILALEASVSGSDLISINVNLQFLEDYSNPVVLSLVLTEDSLAYWQLDGLSPNPDYVHNHMLREVITDVWGTDIDCTGQKGECRKATFSYTLPQGVNRWHVVAMVSDKESRRVLNSVVCE